MPGAKRLVMDLGRAAKARGGLIVWVNKVLPPSGLRIPVDLVFQGDCDEVASVLSC